MSAPCRGGRIVSFVRGNAGSSDFATARIFGRLFSGPEPAPRQRRALRVEGHVNQHVVVEVDAARVVIVAVRPAGQTGIESDVGSDVVVEIHRAGEVGVPVVGVFDEHGGRVRVGAVKEGTGAI